MSELAGIAGPVAAAVLGGGAATAVLDWWRHRDLDAVEVGRRRAEIDASIDARWGLIVERLQADVDRLRDEATVLRDRVLQLETEAVGLRAELAAIASERDALLASADRLTTDNRHLGDTGDR